MKKSLVSRKTHFTRRAATIILALTLMASLVLPSFASQSVVKTSPSLTYETWNNGRLLLSTGSTYIRDDWDKSGCALHGVFDGDCTMRRLRLTFYEAYNLPRTAQAMKEFNSYDGVMGSTYGGSRVLRNQLSDYAEANCRGNDGIQTLENLKQYPDYKYYTETQRTVDGLLNELNNGARAASLRKSLSFFFPETMLARLNAAQLVQLSDMVMGTPEYIAFHNSLYGHDCATVNGLVQQGYSVSYIAEVYTQQAITAVYRIWPDYTTRVSAYWNQTHAW